MSFLWNGNRNSPAATTRDIYREVSDKDLPVLRCRRAFLQMMLLCLYRSFLIFLSMMFKIKNGLPRVEQTVLRFLFQLIQTGQLNSLRVHYATTILY